MKTAIAAIAIAGILSLSGCGGEVNKVKNATFPLDATYKIGQVLDKREVCDSIGWDARDDEKGRRIIEYRCSLKGVDDFVQTVVKRIEVASGQSAQAARAQYDQSIEALKSRISTDKDELARGGDRSDDLGDPGYESKIARLTKQISEGKARLAALQEEFSEGGDSSGLRAQMEAVQSGLDHDGRILASTQRANEYVKQQRRSNQQYSAAHLEENVREEESRLTEMVSGRDAYFRKVEKAETDLRTVDARLDGVVEVFDWALVDGKEPVLVYAGYRNHYENGKQRDQAYSSERQAFSAVMNQPDKTYEQYMGLDTLSDTSDLKVLRKLISL